MKTAIGLEDVTIFPVVEQQGPFFDAMEFLPMLTGLAENSFQNRAVLRLYGFPKFPA